MPRLFKVALMSLTLVATIAAGLPQPVWADEDEGCLTIVMEGRVHARCTDYSTIQAQVPLPAPLPPAPVPVTAPTTCASLNLMGDWGTFVGPSMNLVVEKQRDDGWLEGRVYGVDLDLRMEGVFQFGKTINIDAFTADGKQFLTMTLQVRDGQEFLGGSVFYIDQRTGYSGQPHNVAFGRGPIANKCR